MRCTREHGIGHSAVMLFSIINFVFNDHFPFPNGPEGAFVHLGFPPHFIG